MSRKGKTRKCSPIGRTKVPHSLQLPLCVCASLRLPLFDHRIHHHRHRTIGLFVFVAVLKRQEHRLKYNYSRGSPPSSLIIGIESIHTVICLSQHAMSIQYSARFQCTLDHTFFLLSLVTEFSNYIPAKGVRNR